jgi:tungstate transport system substrate-binding protein
MKRAIFALLPLVLTHNVWSQSIILASTTSTEQSGFFAHLLPLFRQAKAIDVRVVALGTGQALDMGRRGDADVLLVHDTAAEEKFVAEGWGIKRLPVMYNDFVLVGAQADPAKVRGKDILKALRQLAASDHEFISRGDKSGTHAAELRLWKLLDQEIGGIKGYKACGCGMGPALNMAAAKSAYVLTDRGTWLSFKNKGDLVVLVQGDARLFNPYGVIVVNPAAHPHVKSVLAQQFADWLVSFDGQKAIASYTIGGEPLFFPNAAVNKTPGQ